ncbi:single-stranded DNA-binding protein [Candidatus Oscillochloris fontis]|uniref:single-stranded DNA-binding protein n=1 Tax=Candidatus Oscillochloris fontis TaxID=2496868 RepID=UPI00101D133E|nr:single-stranded DNA-binding protein [Candidatus Oscillochloris fontis]
MARDLNKVQLTGRLGANPTIRHTAQGSAISTFRIASNRSWRSSSGVAHRETEWFHVVAWDQLADLCQQSLVKGDHIYIEGRLKIRQLAESNGRNGTIAEVIASEIILLNTQDVVG